MRCVTGEKNAAEAKFRGDFSVALKTRGIFHVDEQRAGQYRCRIAVASVTRSESSELGRR